MVTVLKKNQTTTSMKGSQKHKILKAALLDTKLGSMMAISDETVLYRLEFIEKQDFQCRLEKLYMEKKVFIVEETSAPIQFLKQELAAYFSRDLQEFKTSVDLQGTSFQSLVWQYLKNIPYGQTRSYKQQAQAIGKHSAHRAVANANGKNPIVLIFPCHRIIHNNGGIGGYAGGVCRKQWLLTHERHSVL